MEDPFDAYYVWLGIPPHEQPPHYYRLLGVQLFECSEEVITNAAYRQAAYLRTCQAGPHADTCAQLLNEIAAAKICLLDGRKKQAYDKHLRLTLAQGPSTAAEGPVSPRVPIAQASHVSEVPAIATGVDAPSVRLSPLSSGRYLRNGRSKFVKIVVGGFVGVAIALLLVQFVDNRNTPPSTSKPSEHDSGVVVRSPTKPVITDVSVAQSAITNGGTFSITITVASDTPVNWVRRIFEGPSGTLFGGGNRVRFNEKSPGIWQLTINEPQISEWAPSGRYFYSGLSVKNAARLQSDEWEGEPSVTVTNVRTATKPVITDVSVAQSIIKNGGTFTITITAASDAPVRLASFLAGPSGILFSGGGIFKETSPGIWQCTRDHRISKWAPSGRYYYSEIFVRNEGQLDSDKWKGEPSVSVTNSQTATKPVITDVSVAQSDITNGRTAITITITAASNAPVNAVSCCVQGPSGTLLLSGGWSGARFNETSSGIWQLTRAYRIAKETPSGRHYYLEVSVRNEGQLKSDKWKGSGLLLKS